MAFTHGDAAVYEDIVGIVDDPVHDRFGDRAAFRRSWINPFIPVIRSILGTEEQKIIDPFGLLMRASTISKRL